MENRRQEGNVENWSETVEDLVATGDNEGAISLLEMHVSKLQTLASSNNAVLLQLTSALADLANLYSSKGFSLKADELRSRASLLKHQVLSRYHLVFSFLLPFPFLSVLMFGKLWFVASKMLDQKEGIT